MSLIIREKLSTYKPVPAGTHLGVCVLICDMGKQDGRYGPKEQVFLQWEVPGQLAGWRDKEGIEHTGPMRIGKFYTHSLDRKAKLRFDLENWRGKPFSAEELRAFDIRAVLGVPCLLCVTNHETLDGATKANVSTVMSVPTDTKVPELSTQLLAYDVDDDDPETFHALPEWLQEKVKARLPTTKSNGQPREESAAPPPAAVAGEAGEAFDDEIPF